MPYNGSGKTFDLKLEVIGGLSAGIIGTVVGFPLDLIKTRLQTAGASFTHSSFVTNKPGVLQVGIFIVRQGKVYSIQSLLDHLLSAPFIHDIKSEGFWSLYKGITPSLFSLSILNTLNFSSYNYLRSTWLDAQRGLDLRNACAGAMVGPLAGSISTVELLIKTQMQLDNVSEKRFRGAWHCLSTIVRENGWSALYVGHGTNVTREAVFLGTYFFTYEAIKQWLLETGQLNLHLTVPISGGIAGAWSWFVSFPFDCIRAGIQGRPLSQGRIGALEVATDLYQRKGIMGLYSGLKPSIVRAFLVSASRFSAYEFALWFINN